MNKILLLSPLFFVFGLNAQDTIRKKYPGTDQVWEVIYKGNEKHAENIYHANGQVWMTVQIEASVEDWEWYFEDSSPYFKAEIKADKLIGNYQVWYPNGQLAERLQFANHIENGSASFFYENGQLAMTGSYSNGEMAGTWRFFDTKGEPYEGRWEWFFAANPKKRRMKGEVKEGQMTGKWEYLSTVNHGTENEVLFRQSYADVN